MLPPDVNECGHRFVVAGGNIRFGLDAVKNVGAAAVDAIIAARDEGGPFTSIWDFCRRVDCRAVNKKAIEALIKCGALDSTGATRTGHAAGARAGAGSGPEGPAGRAAGPVLDLRPRGARARGIAAPVAAATCRCRRCRTSAPQLNAWEKETLGLFLSSHPLKEVRPALKARVGVLARRAPQGATASGSRSAA